jgi:hypothetical protein
LTQSEIGVLEEFAVIMYDQSSSTNKVNDASLDLFARKQRPYNGIPPSRDALVEHIKRSVFQAGHTWGQSLCKSPHGELKQWNTSVAFSNTFQACHAVLLPFPTNADTVSQPVNA